MKQLLSAAAFAALLAACQPAAEAPKAPTPAPAAPVTPAPAPAPADDAAAANLDVLAVTYDVTISGAAAKTCKLTLAKDVPAGAPATVHTATPDAACKTALPGFETVARWTPTAAGSLSLLDAAGATLGDFSPVQDTAVYLRGGIAGKLYELKPPQ